VPKYQQIAPEVDRRRKAGEGFDRLAREMKVSRGTVLRAYDFANRDEAAAAAREGRSPTRPPYRWSDLPPPMEPVSITLERSNGRIRVEAEGRYRGFFEQTYLGFNENFSPRHPNPVGIVQAKNYGCWSALANVWRDFRLTDHVDLYGGGGIAAGFQTSFQQIDGTKPVPLTKRDETGFAWQIGVGGIWNVSERVAVDAGYRLFGTGWTMTRESFAAGFPRNEILVILRIYEPFRGLMR
jgi:hypothetical protein